MVFWPAPTGFFPFSVIVSSEIFGWSLKSQLSLRQWKRGTGEKSVPWTKWVAVPLFLFSVFVF
jgi:hypothetical protein